MRARLLVLLLLPQLVLLGRGVVLCVAPGGHFELEVATAPCCATDTPPDTPEGEDPHSCPSCSHIEVVGVAVSPSERQADDPGELIAPSHQTVALSLASELARTPRILPRGAPPPGLAHLRGTVLRL